MAGIGVGWPDRILRMTTDLSGFLLSTPASSAPASQAETEEIRRDLKDVERTLERIKYLLADAEAREAREDRVRLWLRELYDLAYEADDLLDLYQYEVAAMEVQEREGARDTTGLGKRKHVDDQVCASKLSPHSPFEDPSFRGVIADLVKRLKMQFDKIYERNWDLNLYSSGRLDKKILYSQPVTAPDENEEIVGRDTALTELVHILCSESELSVTHNLRPTVIALLGMGGVGKTTLAQLAYNNSQVRSYFDMMGWVIVSQDFVVLKLIRAVLEVFSREPDSLVQLSSIQEHLARQVEGRRFFLVMDDVWNENSLEWERFLSCLPYGAPGSKLLITTRSRVVANMARATHIVHLDALTEEEGWFLFSKYAFRNRRHPELEKIGKRIVMKCRGLPLALKVLGHYLGGKDENNAKKAWMGALESGIWGVDFRENVGKQILGPLLLSYGDLPAYLKPCLQMCNIFPADRIRQEDLVSLWIAHDLIMIRDKHNWIDLQDEGLTYIEQLSSRLFLQRYRGSDGKFEYLAMPGLIHDMVQFLNRQDGTSLRSLRLTKSSLSLNHENLEHLRAIFCDSNYETDYCESLVSKPLINLHICKHLRSLKIPVVGVIDLEQIYELYNLRELQLAGGFSKLSESIANLRNLLRLELVNVCIEMLPKSIGRLPKLQSLVLKPADCGPYTLPTWIVNLTSLRQIHVVCSSTESNVRVDGFYLPAGFGNLKNIQKLGDYFEVGFSSEQAGIKEFNALNDLKGSLKIQGLGNVFKYEHAMQANLIKKRNVLELSLSWYGSRTNMEKKENQTAVVQREEQVLENLRPHHKLMALHITKWSGTLLPSWLRQDPPYLTRLVTLSLTACSRLGPLLSLDHMHGLQLLWIENCPIEITLFPSTLKQLYLKLCNRLEFIDLYNLSALEAVQIVSCTRLGLIKSHTSKVFLKRLLLFDCPLLRPVIPLFPGYHFIRRCPLIEGTEIRDSSPLSDGVILEEGFNQFYLRNKELIRQRGSPAEEDDGQKGVLHPDEQALKNTSHHVNTEEENLIGAEEQLFLGRFTEKVLKRFEDTGFPDNCIKLMFESILTDTDFKHHIFGKDAEYSRTSDVDALLQTLLRANDDLDELLVLQREASSSSSTKFPKFGSKGDIETIGVGEHKSSKVWDSKLNILQGLDQIKGKFNMLDLDRSLEEDLYTELEKFEMLLKSEFKSSGKAGETAGTAKNVVGRFFISEAEKSLSFGASLAVPLLLEILRDVVNRRMKYITFVDAVLGTAEQIRLNSTQVKTHLFELKGEMDQLLGREEQLEWLERQLLEEEHFPQFQAITISGEAGVGKTALARKVYHAVQDVGGFDVHAWIYLSTRDNINLQSMPYSKEKYILDLVAMQLWGQKKYNFMEEKEKKDSEDKLKKLLVSSKFLIVIDDVNDPQLLNVLLKISPHSRNGCRIMMTTRMQSTQLEQFPTKDSALGEEAIHHIVQPLKAEEGLAPGIAKLLKGSQITVMLDELGDDPYRSIVEICWRKLPPEIKLCFAYVATFPGNYEYDVEKLIRIWVAFDFINAVGFEQGMHTEEVLAESYLNQLVCRGLLHITKTDSFGKPMTWMICKDFRLSRALTKFKLYLIEQIVKDRQVLKFNNRHVKFINFKFLKVLDLDGGGKKELPDSIGELIHLRYLGLRYNPLTTLPQSVRDLMFLQTLDVRDTNIPCLPEAVWKIQSLRHICGFIDNVPKSLENLTALQTLDTVIGGSWIDNSLSRLTCLRRLSIYRGESLQITAYNCHGLPPYLDEVHLSWAPFDATFLELLGGLKFLRILSLTLMQYDKINCPQASFPALEVLWLKNMWLLDTWMVEERALPKLNYLTLENCERLTALPGALRRPPIIKNLKLINMPRKFKTRG